MSFAGEADTGRRALAQDASAEMEQFGRPTSCFLIELGGCFDQSTVFHQTAEVLLMQAHAGQCFDDPLQLKKSELGRKQFENHRAIF